MKALTEKDMISFLRKLTDTYNVLVPVVLPDGTRVLGTFEDGSPALTGGRLHSKPTQVFLPQFEKFMEISGNESVLVADDSAKPILVAGFTAEDLRCLKFIDTFFSNDFPDGLYFKKREEAVVVGISGKCGEGGSFLSIAGGDCDLELIFDGESFVISPYSDIGARLIKELPDNYDSCLFDQLKEQSKDSRDSDSAKIIMYASDLMRAEKVPSSFWDEISDQCIFCNSCIFSCPTCTCFECYDLKYADRIERCRMWDSCLLDGFMREASGHNPMKSESSRSHRRIQHKLVDDRIKWGHITCYLCGRCDDICPTGLGIVSISKKIVDRFGERGDQ